MYDGRFAARRKNLQEAEKGECDWWWAISIDQALRSRARLHGTRSISVDPRVALEATVDLVSFVLNY
jgi:hypothetical protein